MYNNKVNLLQKVNSAKL